jgi:hypothetical protein
MAGDMQRSGRKKKTGKRSKLAREGQVVSRMFDSLGSRPYPTNGIGLEQSIQLELTYLTQSVVSSSATSGIPMYAAMAFSIGQTSGAAALLATFDQYRIDQIETWFEDPNPNSAVSYPDIISAVDLDDNNTPTSVGQVQDHAGSLMSAGPGGHYHRWRPHIALAAYSGAFTSYSNVPSMWIDSASPNVQHFGLKVATVSNSGQVAYNVVTRMVVSLRAPVIS